MVSMQQCKNFSLSPKSSVSFFFFLKKLFFLLFLDVEIRITFTMLENKNIALQLQVYMMRMEMDLKFLANYLQDEPSNDVFMAVLPDTVNINLS